MICGILVGFLGGGVIGFVFVGVVLFVLFLFVWIELESEVIFLVLEFFISV